jgi:CheY-like chemotaxis protein
MPRTGRATRGERLHDRGSEDGSGHLRRQCSEPEARTDGVEGRRRGVYIVRRVAPPSPAPPLGGLRVLVVDDDRVALTVLCAMLRGAGAEVEGVGGGAEALDRLKNAPFDFLLCDIYMGGMDGFEVVRRVRQLSPAPVGAVPAAAITAHPSYENRRDALRAGFQDLVTKPVDPAALVDVVLKLARPETA